MPRADVLIVGGGVIGASCARSLSRRGASVSLVEAGPKPGTASLAAAGMLAPLAEAEAGDPLLSLAVRARDYYAELAPALLEETGINIELRQGGVLEVAFTEDEVASVRAEVAWQRQSGFTAEWLSGEEFQELAPGMAPEALGAAYATEDGALNPLALLQALSSSAEAAGTEIVRDEEVTEVLTDGSSALGVATAKRQLDAGAVLIANGAWSGRLAGLPRPLSVQPIRGQMAATYWPHECPEMVVYGGGGYVLPRSGETVAGSTMENAGFEINVTDAGLDHIRAVVRKILPSLGDVRFDRTWAGLRPCTPDGKPIIGADPEISGLWYATGHGRNGILLAGFTGELIAELLLGEEVEIDLSMVSPTRFWSW